MADNPSSSTRTPPPLAWSVPKGAGDTADYFELPEFSATTGSPLAVCIQHAAKRSGIPPGKLAFALTYVFEEMCNQIVQGSRVRIPGFGLLYLRLLQTRMANDRVVPVLRGSETFLKYCAKYGRRRLKESGTRRDVGTPAIGGKRTPIMSDPYGLNTLFRAVREQMEQFHPDLADRRGRETKRKSR